VGEVVALVLARGLGRRMRERMATAGENHPLTSAQEAAAGAGQKGLMPMSQGARPGRPFLDYVLSALADAGFRSVGLVVAPEHDALLAHYSGSCAPSRLAIAFVVEPRAIGTADAVRSAQAFIRARTFVVVNSDNLYPVEVLRAMRALEGPGLPVFERDELVRSSGIPPERVAGFALLSIAPDGTLAGIVEKPGADAIAAAGPHALLSMNCWKFDERIFDACRDVARSARGEFELPEAVGLAIKRGVRFRTVPARGPVLDLSRREDVARVSARLADLEVRL
jgi:glucose-1-phosphate thymidylyltransferase